MTVDPARAAGSYEYGGKNWYFCSRHCLEKFSGAPEKYTVERTPPEHSHPPDAAASPIAPAGVEYTCPMHPEIVRDGPGSCPICGMALEPRTATAEEPENPELADMRRRFWVSLSLTAPLVVLAMGNWGPVWLQLALATPVVLWGGWPFFVRAWSSVVNRALNMFTLIGMGVGVAYIYSLVAALAPRIFPDSFRGAGGT